MKTPGGTEGAQRVILGCTEIPIIITPENSPLPVLDSTRLLGRFEVRAAIDEQAFDKRCGWLPVPAQASSPIGRTPVLG